MLYPCLAVAMNSFPYLFFIGMTGLKQDVEFTVCDSCCVR